MKCRQLLYRVLFLALLTCTWGLAAPARADFTYDVTVNTSGVQGTDGYLDFQFNPGDSNAKMATVQIQNYLQTGGTLSNTSTNTGDAVGTLSGTLKLDNGTSYNDIFQELTFGSQLSFQLTLSGDAITNPGGTAGSSFALSLYGSDGSTPLLTTDQNGGSVLTLNLNSDGTTQVQTFPTDSNPGSTSVAEAAPVSSVPAPTSLVLLGSALACLGGYGILRRKRLLVVA